ncbi:hypothetical protein FOZ63_020795, partial [Perkinsus olseni]
VMISEGMEERGSTGFKDAIKWAIHNNWIGQHEASAVISTNSQWILENRPCVCYAMRGVIDVSIQVTASGSTTLDYPAHRVAGSSSSSIMSRGLPSGNYPASTDDGMAITNPSLLELS